MTNDKKPNGNRVILGDGYQAAPSLEQKGYQAHHDPAKVQGGYQAPENQLKPPPKGGSSSGK